MNVSSLTQHLHGNGRVFLEGDVTFPGDIVAVPKEQILKGPQLFCKPPFCAARQHHGDPGFHIVLVEVLRANVAGYPWQGVVHLIFPLGQIVLEGVSGTTSVNLKRIWGIRGIFLLYRMLHRPLLLPT